MPDLKSKIHGAKERAEREIKDHAELVTAQFHIRNGLLNDDGSRGVIMISPGELADALAYMASRQ